MPRVYLEVGLRVLPADECFWLLWAGCGCLLGSTHADVAPTEDLAWRMIFHYREDERRYRRKGARAELVHRSDLPDLVRLMSAPCEHGTGAS